MQKLTVTFLNHGPLANLLGGKSALIATEDGAVKRYAGTIELGQYYLREFVEEGKANSDDAAGIERQMLEQGMWRDVQDIRDRCMATKIEPGSIYGFEMCKLCPACECVPHGGITKNEQFATDRIDHFVELFETCQTNVNKGNGMNVNDALTTLQQAIVGGLPLTPTEVKRMMTDLPPDMQPSMQGVYVVDLFTF